MAAAASSGGGTTPVLLPALLLLALATAPTLTTTTTTAAALPCLTMGNLTSLCQRTVLPCSTLVPTGSAATPPAVVGGDGGATAPCVLLNCTGTPLPGWPCALAEMRREEPHLTWLLLERTGLDGELPAAWLDLQQPGGRPLVVSLVDNELSAVLAAPAAPPVVLPHVLVLAANPSLRAVALPANSAAGTLDLTNCGLLAVAPGAFRNLSCGQCLLGQPCGLDLSDNAELLTVGSMAFASFCSGRVVQALPTLRLSGCPQLQIVGSMAFAGVQLETLTISNNTQLTNISSNAFSGALVFAVTITHNPALRELESNVLAALNTYSIDLRHNGLVVVRPLAFLKTQAATVTLANTAQLAEISGQAFQSAGILTLDLSNCTALRSIHDLAFLEANMGNITLARTGIRTSDISLLGFAFSTILGIDLTFNGLTELGPQLLQVYNLQVLNLSHNAISILPHANGLSPNYYFGYIAKHPNTTDFAVFLPDIIDLTCNSITNIEPNAMSGAILNGLYLQHNRIRSLDSMALADAVILDRLDLQHNRITSIAANALRNAQITALDLSHNQLASVADYALSGLSASQLLAHDNNLTALFIGTFSGVRLNGLLDLANNNISVLGKTWWFGLPMQLQVDMRGSPSMCNFSVDGPHCTCGPGLLGNSFFCDNLPCNLADLPVVAKGRYVCESASTIISTTKSSSSSSSASEPALASGEFCTLQCNKGYEAVGEPIRCLGGVWSRGPTCVDTSSGLSTEEILIIVFSLVGANLVGIGVVVVVRRFRKLKHDLGSKSELLQLKELLLAEREEEINNYERIFSIDFREVQIERPIDQGAFGEVSCGVWNGLPVAVKVLRQTAMYLSDTATQEFEAEVARMRQLRHPHIVHFYGAGINPDGNVPFLVTELMAGSLRDLLQRAHDAGHPLSWPVRLRLAGQAARGLDYLHSLGLVHRDIKCGNMLVGSNIFPLKIADFGTAALAKVICQGRAGAGGRFSSPDSDALESGTPAFMAPEILRGEGGGREADIYALGLVYWELGSHQRAWEAELSTAHGPVLAIMRRLVLERRLRPPLGPDWPADFAALIQSCWSEDAASRPAAAAIVVWPGLEE